MARVSFEEFTQGQTPQVIKTTAPVTSSAQTESPDSAMNDLRRGFQGAKDGFAQAADERTAIDARTNPLSRSVGQFAGGLKAAGGALASLGEGAVRALPGGTTAMNVLQSDQFATGLQKAEQLAGKAIPGLGAAQKVQDIGIGLGKAGYEQLPPGGQEAVKDIGQGIVGGLQVAGALTLPGVSKEITKQITGNLERKFASIPKTTFKVNTTRAGDLITKYRTQLSDIDPRYETVLKQQVTPEKTMAYFDQAEKAATDPAAPMATKLAADRAVEAYKTIDTTLSEVGKAKSQLLDSISTVKMPGNIPGNAIDNVKNTVGERFGIQIDNKGNITQIQGRVASVDDKSQKLISEYISGLRALGPSPTARQLDDFVDAMQRKLYKQSSPNLFDVADEPVIAFLKQQTGEINSKLKTNVDSILKLEGKDASYGALNEKYSNLYDVAESLNKRLGTEGDKGASLMKSLFSPQTGEPTRRLFQQIKDETGVDLFEEATLAKFAMESVGDPRSKSLLQQLDALSGDVSKLNLVEPGSWLNFIREKADLDGKALAEAIIKQSSDARKAELPVQSNTKK